VEDGAVDYAMMKAHGEPELATYLRSLEAVCPEDYAGFTREQRLAFWVNAYNAYTVRLIRCSPDASRPRASPCTSEPMPPGWRPMAW
jgi:hypothetical protein